MNPESCTTDNKDVQGANRSRSAETSGVARIKDLVQRYRVCWEVYPERAPVGKEIRNIGYSLELYGTHEPGTGLVSPGCIHCRGIQSALNEIAKWILPREQRASWYEVTIDRRSFTHSRQRAERPDIRATIRILHRSKWDQPVDACEMRCLSEMEHALRELGACPGAWRPSQHEPSAP